MTKTRADLTELEGAMLGVLRQVGRASAYRIRQVFLNSRSAEWSGSAGAVYPAIRRLQALGLLAPHREKDGRGTTTFTLTPVGLVAHDRWLCDVERAVGPGMDPFRTRAALWRLLPAAKRRALLQALRKALTAQRDSIAQGLPALEPENVATDELLLALLTTRLDWLKEAG